MITNTDIIPASFVLREEKIYSKAEERESRDVDHPRGYIPRLVHGTNSCSLFMTTSRFGNIVVGHKKSLILSGEVLNLKGQRIVLHFLRSHEPLDRSELVLESPAIFYNLYIYYYLVYTILK